MQEAKSLNITLDGKSIEILKKVDGIHRDSLINVGLALVEKTGYYKTLTGENKSDSLDDVASLDLDDDTGSKPKAKSVPEEPQKTAKPATTWDAF